MRKQIKGAAREGALVDVDWAAWEASYENFYEPIGDDGAPYAGGYAVLSAPRRSLRLRVVGARFTPDTKIFAEGKALATRCVSATIVETIISARIRKVLGSHVRIAVTGGRAPLLIPLTLGNVDRPAITDVRLTVDVPRHDRPFGVVVSFAAADGGHVSAIKLAVTYPSGRQESGTFVVGAKERQRGKKVVSGFRSRTWGPMYFTVTAYSSSGSASTRCFKVVVVPNNPVQVQVYPHYKALGSSGAVRWVSFPEKYFCDARCVLANGYDFPILVYPPVLVTVGQVNAAAPITSFGFNLNSSYGIRPWQQLTLYLNTFFTGASPVADVLEDFGKIWINFTFSTSVGRISSAAYWAMMGQVNVACNFVGAFDSRERATVRNLVVGAASALFQQVDLAVVDAPILEIPSSHPDWANFRDIHIDTWLGITSAEADQLRGVWSSPAVYRKHIDLWFVESFSGKPCATALGGFSPVPGPASKWGSNSGIVIDVKNLDPVNSATGRDVLAVVIAHEIGHYLGLPHDRDDPLNLMAPTSQVQSTRLTQTQHDQMVRHAWVERQS